ncbi:hypothetical protein SAMN05421866_0021 [Chryseobacterium oranimense]|uniref:Uncharacterized protein n=1 Tax=Chryseobacterium oranimense TaxID=421058 RepID=A0A1M5X7B7_9FLAO|nr:hypothetical protein [Chryseobacterium oranimense]SHH95681.1 hypothetical protein SAMN05421866_0021 [Chryseobacterium oranimense]
MKNNIIENHNSIIEEEFKQLSLVAAGKLIETLKKYNDEYSLKLRSIIEKFICSKSFTDMKLDMWNLSESKKIKNHIKYDFNTNSLISELIYPSI